MKRQTLLFLGLGTILFTTTLAQTWIDEYQRGLDAAKTGDWAIARERFQKAATFRGEDSNVASELPGGSGRNRAVWRGGSPYSPNFAAAYSGYRLSLETADTGERTKLLMTTARELEGLLKKGQHSIEAYYTLGLTYNLLRDQDMVEDVEKRQLENGRLGWKVDSEFMSPDELASVLSLRQQLVAVKPPEQGGGTTTGGGGSTTGTTGASTTGTTGEATTGTTGASTTGAQTTGTAEGTTSTTGAGGQTTGTTGATTPPATTTGGGNQTVPKGPGVQIIKARDLPGLSQNGNFVSPTNITGRVPTLPYKYALVVGNTESLLPDGRLNYAATDAMLVAEALKQHGGYDDANVEILQNATADQIRISAQAMADRIPENATITLFLSGVGQNVAGDDYFAGVESATMYDTTTMVKVDTLLRAFMAKGARIFLFYQVSRPIRDGRYFGQRPPEVGAVAQMMGTMPGSMVGSIVDKGQERGIYALAFARTLEQTRSNQIHIMDFGWSVFNAMKGGNPASPGGGGNQVPTLPVLSYLSNDARF